MAPNNEATRQTTVRIESLENGAYRDGDTSFRITLAARIGERSAQHRPGSLLLGFLRGIGYIVSILIVFAAFTIMDVGGGSAYSRSRSLMLLIPMLIGGGIVFVGYLMTRPLAKRLEDWVGARKSHKEATLEISPISLRTQDGVEFPRAKLQQVRVAMTSSLNTCSLIASGELMKDHVLFESVQIMDVDEILQVLRRAGVKVVE